MATFTARDRGAIDQSSSCAVIKPTYMLLTLVIVIVLWRAKGTDLRLLFHGALWFLLGEVFCAINFCFKGSGWVQNIDLLHGAGMVVMSTLIPWGLFRFLDDRIVQFSNPEKRCLVQKLCGRCWKRDPVRCGPHDIMLLIAGALAGLSLMPLSSNLRPTSFITTVFESPVDYGAPIVNHLIELRLYPVLGAALLTVAFGLLWGRAKAIRRAEPVFFTGLGFVGYSMLRHLLVNTHGDELWWSDFWEESTELVMILTIGLLLIVFRKQLGLGRVPAKSNLPGSAKAEPTEAEPAA